MKSVYSSPFRVYLILGLLGLLGLWTAGKLPLSLYPNSTRPTISAGVSYGAMTSDEFLRSYGK
jgi:multidrug efflux pump subunit AcrB